VNEPKETTAESPSADRPNALVWDIPVRLIHWTMVGTFAGAFGIATLSSKRGSLFAIHMLLGLVLGFVVLFRVVWGLVGSRYARFGSFAFSPAALWRYLRDAKAGRDEPHAGHNPGSSYAIYAMLLLPLGLVTTGLVKPLHEAHEVLAWSMVAIVSLHIVGLGWHTFRHREAIALSMFHGRRTAARAVGIVSAHPLVGALFVALTGAWAFSLYSGYDAQNKQVVLPVVGTTIKLGGKKGGEGEGRRGKPPESRRRGDHDDDGDDDD
jgi:cytochrome b